MPSKVVNPRAQQKRASPKGDNIDPGIETLEDTLAALLKKGRFRAVVLATEAGLPIAAVTPRDEADVTSAMVALLTRVSKEARDQLGMAAMDEVSVVDRDRTRLVCRSLFVDGEELLLAVLVRPRGYYRRATNWAIRQIRKAWRHWKRS
jgi:predicted regulator of Ras-like GTPase activity (Roadblock/LC7/MglB family)